MLQQFCLWVRLFLNFHPIQYSCFAVLYCNTLVDSHHFLSLSTLMLSVIPPQCAVTEYLMYLQKMKSYEEILLLRFFLAINVSSFTLYPYLLLLCCVVAINKTQRHCYQHMLIVEVLSHFGTHP